MPQQKTRIKIPKGYSPRERKAIAQDVIDFIVERTENGHDKSGKRFPGYSKSYKESLDFKNAGKTSKVDLTLSGEMLSEIDLLTQRNGSITVGYDAGDTELNGKVEGNRKGTYGKKKANKSKARDFLGLSKTALQNILKKYPLGDTPAKEAKRLANLVIRERATERAQEIGIDTGTNDTESE